MKGIGYPRWQNTKKGWRAWDYREPWKYGNYLWLKHSIYDSKRSVNDSKHSIEQPDDSKQNHNIYAWRTLFWVSSKLENVKRLVEAYFVVPFIKKMFNCKGNVGLIGSLDPYKAAGLVSNLCLHPYWSLPEVGAFQAQIFQTKIPLKPDFSEKKICTLICALKGKTEWTWDLSIWPRRDR